MQNGLKGFKAMDKDNREELEQFFHHYMSALENQDAEALASMWADQAQDRAISIYGLSDGIDAISKSLRKRLVDDLVSIHIVSSEMEVIDQQELSALLYISYDGVFVWSGKKEAVEQTVIETQYLKKDSDGNWKIEYAHQSVPYAQFTKSDAENQSVIIDEMLDLLLGKEGARPRSFRDRRNLLDEKLSKLTSEKITPALLHLQDSLITLEKQHTALTALPFIMSDEQNLSVWSGEPSRLAVDVLISFMKPDQSYDPWLSRRAGLGLQKDNYYHRHILKDKTWTTSNYNLPVKAVIEVALDPVYGLYTPAKKEAFQKALDEAIEKITAAGYHSAAVLPGWRDVLNIPLASGSLQIAESLDKAIHKENSPLKKAVLISAKSDQSRALQSAVDDVNHPQVI